jgi:hypothetical protein
MKRFLLLASSLLASSVLAQEPVKFTGPVVRLNATCTEAQVQALDVSCTESAPCPLFLELASAATDGLRLFVAGNLHTDSATVASILLRSDDQGATWVDAAPRMDGVGLEQMQFVLTHGWAAGATLTPPPARDPFLLVTDDGLNWRKQPVRLRSQAGVIDSYHFRSPSDGLLLIDNLRSRDEGFRYELFETRSAGSTWSVSQMSHSRPNPSPSPTPDPNLRLREDGTQQQYLLEQKFQHEWKTVARFAVPAGRCQPQAPELAPPAPIIPPAANR